MSHSLRRRSLVILIIIVTLSACTLSPLASLWLGSRVQAGGQVVKMISILAIIVSLGVLSFIHLRVLLILNAAYEREVGIVKTRTRMGWLKSMRDVQHEDRPATTPEKALVALVLLSLVILAVWFFGFAHMTAPM